MPLMICRGRNVHSQKKLFALKFSTRSWGDLLKQWSLPLVSSYLSVGIITGNPGVVDFNSRAARIESFVLWS